MSSEPTLAQLTAALNKYAQSIGHAGWESEARNKLQTLRDAKWTWYGADEHRIMLAINRALGN